MARWLILSTGLTYSQYTTCNGCAERSSSCDTVKIDLLIQNERLCIECHGGQHYKSVDFYGGDDFYELQLIHDQMKRDYASENRYKLLEIDCRNTNHNSIIEQLDAYFLN